MLCTITAILGNYVYVQGQTGVDDFRGKSLQDSYILVFIVTANLDSIKYLEHRLENLGISSKGTRERDKVCTEGQQYATLKALLQEIANLQETRMNGRLASADNDPMKIGFFQHIEEISQIFGFKTAAIGVKGAKKAFIHADTVDLELYH